MSETWFFFHFALYESQGKCHLKGITARQNIYFNCKNKALDTDNRCSPNIAGRFQKKTTELLKIIVIYREK